MKILLTGANGYIGKRLLPVLLERGHEVYAAVRDKKRLETGQQPGDNLHILEVDFLQDNPADLLPADLDAAYYLIHSMSASQDDFNELESVSARNFVELIDHTSARQIIYLSGISNAEKLSRHLASRRNVETILSGARASLTNLRAGIIVGSGSASFEIIRDLVEKLPVMVTPKWLNTRCQPIAIRNVIQYLNGVLLHPECMGRTFDIGGPEILTYREMLLQFAEVRNLKRLICTIPVMTPRLSSYWLYFVTAISYNLAVNLVDSMKVEVVCRENRIRDILKIPLIDYRRSIELAFTRIEQNLVLSSWKDAMVSGSRYVDLNKWIEVPRFGCYHDRQTVELRHDPKQVLSNIWNIGGERGWYYANWLWHFRGFLDKLFGGVGLRRGRTHTDNLHSGDALDFWRVILASLEERRLLLFAEMKLPGEAWLEFHIRKREGKDILEQTTTFRPKGLWGRIYWYLLLPFHTFIFRWMCRRIESYAG
jgi:uncharacterized protein YbjT (DUF2867 family)